MNQIPNTGRSNAIFSAYCSLYHLTINPQKKVNPCFVHVFVDRTFQQIFKDKSIAINSYQRMMVYPVHIS